MLWVFVLLFTAPVVSAQTAVSFSAEVSSDRDYFDGATIVFDRVLSNENGLYSSASGQFVCLDQDVYVFIWSLGKAALSGVSFMKATAELRLGASVVYNGPYTSYYASTSVSGPSEMAAIVECQSNPISAVTVGVAPWSTANQNSRFKATTTSFSGFKLGVPGGANNNVVAFSASMSEPMSAFEGTKLVFDDVARNYGEAYLPRYGAFVCPDDDVYVFIVTSEHPDSYPNTRWSNSRLMMNGEQVTKGPMTFRSGSSQGASTIHQGSGVNSMTSVVQCAQGADVYVEAVKAYSFDYNRYGETFSTFSGFRLNGLSVGFTAVLSANHTATTSRNLLFDSVVTNVGDAFQSGLGQFVCPDDDLYVFTVTAVTSQSASLAIFLDSVTIKQSTTSTQSTADSSGTSGSCTNTVITKCQTGRLVGVRDESVNSGTIYLAEYTLFSGYKVPNQ